MHVIFQGIIQNGIVHMRKVRFMNIGLPDLQTKVAGAKEQEAACYAGYEDAIDGFIGEQKKCSTKVECYENKEGLAGVHCSQRIDS